MIRLHARTPPPPPVSKLAIDTSKTEKERQLADRRGWGSGGGRSQIIRRRESMVLYNTINSLWDRPLYIMFAERRCSGLNNRLYVISVNALLYFFRVIWQKAIHGRSKTPRTYSNVHGLYGFSGFLVLNKLLATAQVLVPPRRHVTLFY